jgi:hypothetical protein
MVVVTPEGLEASLDRAESVESDLTRIVRRYIALAPDEKERIRRIKHVLALDGRTVLGLGLEDIRKALKIRSSHISRTLASLAQELAKLGREMGIEDERQQRRFEESLAG